MKVSGWAAKAHDCYLSMFKLLMKQLLLKQVRSPEVDQEIIANLQNILKFAKCFVSPSTFCQSAILVNF